MDNKITYELQTYSGQIFTVPIEQIHLLPLKAQAETD